MATLINNLRNQMAFVATGNPETVDDATAYAPGQLGALLTRGSETFQYVKFDTGATAAAAVTVAAKEIVFWKDADDFLVTTVLNQAPAGRNGVAGVLANAPTPGNYFWMQVGGLASVKTSGSIAAGTQPIANSGSDADVTAEAVGTAPTYRPIGVAQAATSGGNTTVNLTLNDHV